MKRLEETIKNRQDVIEPKPTLEGAMEYAKLVNKHLDKIEVEFDAFKNAFKTENELTLEKIKALFDAEVRYNEEHKTKPTISSLKCMRFDILQLLEERNL